MNCHECEQLFDAYLDGQLDAGLRLEFDAHRLRCGRCQQTLAMLEAASFVITCDENVPPLSASFTDRVMSDIERPRVLRLPRRRVSIATLALVQAAAVLVAAVIWTQRQSTVTAPAAPDVGEVVALSDPGQEAIYKLITERVEDRLWELHTAGRTLTADLVGVARYLDITLPEDLARESAKVADKNAWNYLWSDIVAPRIESETEDVVKTAEVHSI